MNEVFEIDDVVNLNKESRLSKIFLFRIVKPILIFLSDKKIISSVSVQHEKVFNKYRRELTNFNEAIGIIKNIIFVKVGFFQSETFFNKKIANALKIKNIYVKKAFESLKHIPNDSYKIFIHIRRGDYGDYKVLGKSALLPMNYYKNQIDWFLENRKDCYFIFLSDEPEFIKEEFKYLENKLISIDNDFGTDLTIMTLCNSAILSPSSFGWWGSYFMKDRNVVFAPKYWLGFNSKVEYHVKAVPGFYKEITI